MPEKVTIFCASSPGIPQIYFDDAKALAEILVKNGYGIVYGGGAVGLMGMIADTVLQLNGNISGIIPRFMINVEWEHKKVKNMVHVDTMHQRKELLIRDTTAVIALPGGSGTLEELYEVVSMKKMGLFPHPIVLLNTNGYFDPLIEMAHRMAREKFMQSQHLNIWDIAGSPEAVIKAIQNHRSWGPDSINFAAVNNNNLKNQ